MSPENDKAQDILNSLFLIFGKMNNFSERKQDLGGWSAKFGEETRKHRHPCKYNEGHYMMCLRSPRRS